MRDDPSEALQRLRSRYRPYIQRLLWAAAVTLMTCLFALSLLPIPSIARADDNIVEQGDPLTLSVERFLQQRTASLGDQVTIDIRQSAADLGHCINPQPFLPRPGVPQGRVTVGVHCGNDGSQTRYLQATISATVRHLVALKSIDSGQRIDPAMLGWQQSEISRLRRGYLDNMDQASGMVATRRIPDGATLTDNMLRKPWMVKRGDTVVLTAVGQGFRVSRSVEALDNGGLGSTIRLKTENNQILQGTVTGQDRLRVDI
ncbi:MULTISPECIES: flagellar basal body P-ring formation chaperone FlgA [Salinicola]|uniref:Flagella basal body P-ring formation protein FlgA n=1 Tax=Salinicola socius TaxID=404433 RepID=A0A1Q8SVX6_9GAMM|nr:MULTISPECIES: flagellar basal body P-ring formation chaperone FlgA [Salinicola]OLO05590.1 flagella basal body P-ring formation protein FlgA [Salinicola socius]